MLALSCGSNGGGDDDDDDKPPVQDLPQTVLTVPQPNTVGQSLTVQVSASGCDQIESLSIYDGEDFVKSVPYSGTGGAVSVDIGSTEIKYATRGIAAQLTLKSRVVCTDERQNDSLQQPATFFPVAEVIELPAGTPGSVVPDFFVADGSGVLLTFIGCGTLPNGTGRLFKVNKMGSVLASVDMPFPCTVNTVITGMDPQSRKRWVWTPDWGAMAFDEQLRRTASTVVKVDLLSVGPGGDALVWNATGTGAGLSRLSHTGDDNFKWRYTPNGFMITPALVNNNGLVLVASIASDSTLGAAIFVATVDYGDQNPATGGIKTNEFLVKRVASSDPVPTTTPPATFNADGTLIYVAIEGLNQLTQVFACATTANLCQDANQRWVSPVLLGQHRGHRALCQQQPPGGHRTSEDVVPRLEHRRRREQGGRRAAVHHAGRADHPPGAAWWRHVPAGLLHPEWPDLPRGPADADARGDRRHRHRRQGRALPLPDQQWHARRRRGRHGHAVAARGP